MLLALRVVYGLGLALMWPAAAPLLMQWFRPKELPLINSLNISCFILANAVSLSTIAPISEVVGWERALGLFAAVSLVVAVMWLFWGKSQESVEEVAAPLNLGAIKDVLLNRVILVMVAADVAAFSHRMGLTAWLPTFYNETGGMSLTQAGGIISLLSWIGIVAVMLGGLLTLKIQSRRLFFLVSGLLVGLGGLGTYLIDNSATTYVAVIMLGLGSALYLPVLLTLPMELPGMTPQKVAIAWGLMITIANIGAFIAPVAVGAMADGLDSFIPGLLVCSVLAWFLFAAGFLLPKTAPKRGSAPGQ